MNAVKDFWRRNNGFEEALIIFILSMGVLLPLIQLFYNRSLCGDEVWLGLNIVERAPLALLEPLKYKQIAPILFLQIEKIFTHLIPNSEIGLRLFPFISYLGSLFFFYKSLRLVSKGYFIIILSLSLFVFNVYLIFYSNEVKQYMTDVLFTTCIYYCLLKDYRDEKNKYYLLAFLGVIGIFLSNVSVIILTTAGVYLLVEDLRKNNKYFLRMASISAVWLVVFIIYYTLFIDNNTNRALQVHSFSACFLPTNPFNAAFYKFLSEKGTEIILSFFRYANRGMWLVPFILIGVIRIVWEKRVSLFILTIVPVIIHLVLSLLKLYPVEDRLCLYWYPAIILTCSLGADWIAGKVIGHFNLTRFRILEIAVPCLMFCYFIFLVHVGTYPLRRSEIKNSINFIEQHKQPADKIYVTYFATWPYEYYWDISFMKKDTVNTFIDHLRYRDDTTAYAAGLYSIHGRVWFLFVMNGDNGKNMKFISDRLKAKGKTPIQAFHTNDSDAYLYDLTSFSSN